MTVHPHRAERPVFHFSVDDVFDALIELTDSGDDLFDHPFFSYLQFLHREFHLQVDLYLFNQASLRGQLRSLSEVTDRHRETLQDADWLRFGPHAHDYETPPYDQTPEELQAVFDLTFAEIDRIAGPGKTSRWVRLHYFSEAFELAEYFRARGVEALLLTDKDALSYRLPESEKASIAKCGRADFQGLAFRRSHFRMENLASGGDPIAEVQRGMQDAIDHGDHLSLFTHEIELQRDDVRKQTETCLRHATISMNLPSF